MKGYKTYKHKNNPIEKELHDKFIEEYVENKYSGEILEKMIFGCSNDAQTIPNDYLSEREKEIIISTIQWLGSPVGQGFLSGIGFEYKNEK